jgi:hypothetical protein
MSTEAGDSEQPEITTQTTDPTEDEDARFAPYRVHMLNGLIPPLADDEFRALVEDVREHGQHHPIMVDSTGSVIITGRHRFLACRELGVDPKIERLPESYAERMILDFIVSDDLKRQHLTTGQRAAIADRFADALTEITNAEEARRRAALPRTEAGTFALVEPAPPEVAESGSDRHARESVARAAVMAGTSRTTVQQYRAVKKGAPDLAEQVRAGVLAPSLAYERFRARTKTVAERRSALSMFTDVLRDLFFGFYLATMADISRHMARFTPQQQDALRQAAARIVDGHTAADDGTRADATWSATEAGKLGFVVQDAAGNRLV